MGEDSPPARQADRLEADPLAALAQFPGVEAGQPQVAQALDESPHDCGLAAAWRAGQQVVLGRPFQRHQFASSLTTRQSGSYGEGFAGRETMGKVLVLYDSASGNTAKMAGLAAEGAARAASRADCQGWLKEAGFRHTRVVQA